ncbi:MAG TPA: VWA domain-containing protein [Pyrinomonadaceae bacterium]|nr:VWA domain-containing protein [Pyrinomonadaceae bacterium]
MQHRPTNETRTLAALLVAALLTLCPFLEARAQTQRRTQRRPAPARKRTEPKRPAPAPANDANQQTQTQDSAQDSAQDSSLYSIPDAQQETPQQQTPAPATQGAQEAPQEVGEDEVVRVDSNLVSVPATVVDAFGRSVNDLRQQDFELRVDGKPKPIGEVMRAETPVRLAILFDNSASLSKAREFEKQAAVRFFQKVMRPADQAAVYSVSTVPVLARPLTSDVRQLVRTIELFPEPEGATALFDTIAKAAEYLRPHEGRKVILLVSDGNDTVSEKSFDEALKQALASDCQIYVVGTGDIDNPHQLDSLAKRRLAVFAQQTGGAVSIPQSVEDLDAAFERISNDISEQYVVSYYPTDDPPDGRFRALSLSVVTRPNLRVRARRGYYARAGEGAHVRPRRATARNGDAAREKLAELRNVSFDPLNSPQSSTPMSGDSAISGVFIVSAKSRPRGASYPPASETAANVSGNGSLASTVAAAPTQNATDSTTERQTPSNNPNDATKPDAQTRPVSVSSVRESEGASQTKNETPKESAQASAQAPVSGGLLNGKAVSLPKPVYPTAARNVGAKGTVTVEILIDEQGRVIRARAVSGHPLLLQAAVAAARQAKFSPATLSGQPVQVAGTLNYNFIIQ